MESAPTPISARTLYRPWQRIGLVVVGCWFILIGVLVSLNTHDSFGRVTNALVLLCGLFFVLRSRNAWVRVDEKGVTHQNLGRARPYDWCSIRSVVPAHQWSPWPLRRVAMPELSLTSGRWPVLLAIATYSAADARADMDIITTAHAAHRASCRTCTA
ncbi:hypothetical protein [Streptomyces sp. NPDC127092]|uniref:hypothetical protein n=1 Tax=Streptomyces sp. NPDC127092 TaxID=3347135 RepID=UPI003656FD4F